MERINSLQNERVKRTAKLRHSDTRREERRFLIDGLREIRRALAGRVRIVEVFFAPDQCTGEKVATLLKDLEQHGAALVPVSGPVLEKVAYGERSDGLVAVAEAPPLALDSLQLPANACVAVLESVEKPGNIGAVLRSADGAGIAAVIVAGNHVDLFNPNAIRASLGTIFTLPVCAASSSDTLAWLRERQLKIYAARVEGAISHTAANFRAPCAIVLGSEASGLSSLWHDDSITGISLPMRGTADSLNVSAAAAVLFYEALRQRTAS